MEDQEFKEKVRSVMIGFKKTFSGPSHLQMNMTEFESVDLDEINYVNNMQSSRYLLLQKYPMILSIFVSTWLWKSLRPLVNNMHRDQLFVLLNSDFKRKFNASRQLKAILLTFNLITFTSTFCISSFQYICGVH